MNAHTNLNATSRFDLDVAPSPLRFVQDFVNTKPPAGVDAPDLLQNVATANAWLKVAIREWSAASGQPVAALSLTARDLPSLRRFRDQLQVWLADRSVELAARERSVGVSIDRGRAKFRPRQNGGDGVIALACMELLLDSRAGTPPRLKVCANPDCAAAFYDSSRNLSRVWHDVKTCGNQANLRASRSRKRESAGS